MAKVLMVTQPPIAGVPQCVLDWSVGLRDRGWNPVVACPSAGPLTDWCGDAGIRVTRWESERAPHARVRAESARLREILTAEQPDVVVLHSSKAGLVGRLVIRRTLPTAFVPHAWSFDAVGGAMAKAAMTWERMAARWTDVILCVSDAERTRGMAAGIHAQYRLTRNGVDVDAIRSIGQRERPDVKEVLDLSEDTEIVVCVGRLTRQKGQSTLLHAWRYVTGNRPRHLILVGGGPDETELHHLARSCPTVTFIGSVDRAQALGWLAAADLAVVPSRWEGMALVPLEAMALGTPLVATDVTGVREAVTSDIGSVVPPDDPSAMGRALSEWLTRPPETRRRASAHAVARARTHFSLSATVASVDAALTECRAR